MNKLMSTLFASYRSMNGFLFCMAMMGMGFALLFLQKYLVLFPCPLCVFQRVGLIAMGIVSCFAFILNPKKRWVRIPLWLASFMGIAWSTGVAARHVWIQNLPPEKVPSCGPGLDYWLDTLPIAKVFQEVLRGSGECATIDWTFLGMSIPTQALLFFSFLMIVHLFLLVKILKESV